MIRTMIERATPSVTQQMTVLLYEEVNISFIS